MLMYWILGMFLAQASSDVVPGEYLVKLKNTRSFQTLQAKVSGGISLKGQISSAGVLQVKIDNSLDYQTLLHDPEVEYIEPNYVLSKPQPPAGTTVQVLSEGQIQTTLSESAFSNIYSQSYAPVQVPQSWDEYSAFSPSNRPVVAVIDTGVDYSHPVFSQSDAIWRNQSEASGQAGVDDDQNGYVDDFYGWNFNANLNNPNDDEGHGTHVAGIVIGSGFNIFSIPRPQSKIQVMPLKFLDSNGEGRTSDAIRAIYYAVDNGAQVINCSWGGGSYSRSLLDALAYAYSRQVLVVTAAGNSSSNNDVNPMYPAGYDVPANLAVAASTDGDSLASFSNYGGVRVHVAAPGQYIYSTYLGSSYTLLSGTSMAAPFVAGIAALSWRETPQLTGFQVKQLIMNSVNLIGSISGKVSTSGRVNAFNLVSLAKGSTSMLAAQPDFKASGVDLTSQGEAASGGAGGCGLVKALGQSGGGPLGPLGNAALAFLVFMIPVAVWITLRRMHPEQRRKFERFNVNSDIRINLGDREVVGQMKTLSMGGLSFAADDLIEKGSLVTMKIENPSGGREIEVQGRIVWSEEKKSYGVQFQGATQSVSEKILSWTKALKVAP
jgi:subtilisin family serine protease